MSTEVVVERHVQIADFSDRELLQLLVDLGKATSARDMALKIFGEKELEDNEPEIRRQAKCVTMRFVWMKKYGLIDRAETGEWLISAMGESLLNGRLAASVENAITNLKANSSPTLANLVGEKLVGSGDVAGRAMQRELLFQINRRKTRIRGW
jgi:hypothetical protein